jgi:hypothetical protein
LIKRYQVITAVIICIISAGAAIVYVAGMRQLYADKKGCQVSVEIDYAGNLPLREEEIVLAKGMTALSALQAVAEVKTHHIGEYVFVVAIDGVEGVRGENAWYYTINGKNPGELAYSKIIEGPAQIKWSYQKDVCSWKVDNKDDGSAGKEVDKE